MIRVQKIAVSKHFYMKHGDSDYIYDRDKNHRYDIRLLDIHILIYEDMVKTWFLDVGKYLIIKNKVKINKEYFDTGEAGFVILQIATSYVEGNQQYREGKSSHSCSKEFFRKGLKRIFKLVHEDKIIDKFYEQVRCGLFHDGMTKKLVTISGEYEPLTLSDESIRINPSKFLQLIESDFNDYIRKLKSHKNKTLRRNFENFLKTKK